MIKEEVTCLTTIPLKEMEKKLENAAKFMESMEKDYNNIMNKIEKKDVQDRLFIIDLLIGSLINDARLPQYTIIGILDKIKHNIMNVGQLQTNQMNQTISKKHPSYTE